MLTLVVFTNGVKVVGIRVGGVRKAMGMVGVVVVLVVATSFHFLDRIFVVNLFVGN